MQPYDVTGGVARVYDRVPGGSGRWCAQCSDATIGAPAETGTRRPRPGASGTSVTRDRFGEPPLSHRTSTPTAPGATRPAPVSGPRHAPDEQAPCSLPSTDPRSGRLLPVVIGVFPTADSRCRHIGAENKHATLAHFGNDVPADSYPALASRLRTVARSHRPFEVPVESAGALGEAGAFVWFTGCPEGAEPEDPLRRLRADVLADPVLHELYTSVPQFPGFVPHVTVGYEAFEDADWSAVCRQAHTVDSIRFDRLFLWWGPHTLEIPLTGHA